MFEQMLGKAIQRYRDIKGLCDNFWGKKALKERITVIIKTDQLAINRSQTPPSRLDLIKVAPSTVVTSTSVAVGTATVKEIVIVAQT